MNKQLVFEIRDIRKDDFNDLNSHFGPISIYKKPTTLWNEYLKQHSDRVRIVKVIEEEGKIIGYGTVKFSSSYPDFYTKNIPEINDILVAPEYRNKGMGKALISYLETEAENLGYVKIGLAVGLYKDYGSAQRLYIKMGYLPDGNGISYHNQLVEAGRSYPVDDDLLLWLSKKL